MPRNPLDVLAQQIVAMVAVEDRPVPVDEVADGPRPGLPVRRAEPTRRSRASSTCWSGRYPSDEFAELRPRLVWDRLAGTLTARPGARMLAVTSGGTIPDRGLFGVVHARRADRVGELDEEMVYESRVGETFLLGATTWRIEEITRDRVHRHAGAGRAGQDAVLARRPAGRPYELGQAVGPSPPRWAHWSDDAAGRRAATSTQLAVRNLRAYLAEEREATGGLLPTDRQIVVERFRDELGDWRIARAVARSAPGSTRRGRWPSRPRSATGSASTSRPSGATTGSSCACPRPRSRRPPTRWSSTPTRSRTWSSARWAARPCSPPASARTRPGPCCCPAGGPGSRTPLWQQRQRAADLLAVASRYGSFPILLETYRECLRDVFDLPALTR